MLVPKPTIMLKFKKLLVLLITANLLFVIQAKATMDIVINSVSPDTVCG